MGKLELKKKQLEWYKKLQKKIDKILNAELDVEDYSEEVHRKIIGLEDEIYESEEE